MHGVSADARSNCAGLDIKPLAATARARRLPDLRACAAGLSWIGRDCDPAAVADALRCEHRAVPPAAYDAAGDARDAPGVGAGRSGCDAAWHRRRGTAGLAAALG